MKVKNISYPYPVLGNEDDVSGEFTPSFHHKLGISNILLDTSFKLKNKTLRDLIKNKKAKITVEVECSSTFYRAVFSTFQYEEKFYLRTEKCRDKVVVKFYIRAVQPIKNYRIDGCHQDYTEFLESHPIDINTGDILAVGGVSSFIAEKGYDPLKPIVSSFITIKEGNEEEGPMIVNYADPSRIIIKLSKKDWAKYSYLKSKKWIPPVIHASIVMPVLADAIRFIDKNEEEVETYRWCNRIKRIMEHEGLSPDDPLTAAQTILKLPINRALEAIDQYDEIQEEDEEQ